MKGRRGIKSGEAFLLNLPGNISVWGRGLPCSDKVRTTADKRWPPPADSAHINGWEVDINFPPTVAQLDGQLTNGGRLSRVQN